MQLSRKLLKERKIVLLYKVPVEPVTDGGRTVKHTLTYMSVNINKDIDVYFLGIKIGNGG